MGGKVKNYIKFTSLIIITNLIHTAEIVVWECPNINKLFESESEARALCGKYAFKTPQTREQTRDPQLVDKFTKDKVKSQISTESSEDTGKYLRDERME